MESQAAHQDVESLAAAPAAGPLAGDRSSALDLVRLSPLMAETVGEAGVVIGLIDGPVAAGPAGLANVRAVPGGPEPGCTGASGLACRHGTFIASVLAADRGGPAPAICPGCTLLVRPIFLEAPGSAGALPDATPDELAEAIEECVGAGARVLNLSVALSHPSSRGERRLEAALDLAARRRVIVVAAAGNQGAVGGSAITRHPWVIPVAAYDRRGRPMGDSNFGASIGRRGLGAPGEAVPGLDDAGRPVSMGGTSAAAPFVAGAVALLWSASPAASAEEVRSAVILGAGVRRTAIVPPLLDAEGARRRLAGRRGGNGHGG